MRRYTEDEVEEMHDKWSDFCQRFNMYSSVGIDEYALDVCQRSYNNEYLSPKELKRYSHILDKDLDRNKLKAELYEFMKQDVDSYDIIFYDFTTSHLTPTLELEMLEWYKFNYTEDEENLVLIKAIDNKINMIKTGYNLI